MASLKTVTEFGRDEVESEDDEQFVPPPSSWFESLSDNLGTEDLEASDLFPQMAAAATTTTTLSSPTTGNDDTPKFAEQLQSPPFESDLHLPQSHPAHHSSQSSPAKQRIVIGHTHPSPSWKEISSQVLPAAAKELLSSSLRRIYYTARISYSNTRWHRKYSDIGNNAGGFSLSSQTLEQLPSNLMELPPFSSLPWLDRQLVKEWRTYLPDDDDEEYDNNKGNNNIIGSGGSPEKSEENDEDLDFERARTLVPNPLPRPKWQKHDVCRGCHKPFGPMRLRHHCRVCGNSFCQNHSSSTHSLPHLGYDPDVAERVCDSCKTTLMEQNLAERVAWRLARCRDYTEGALTPYFETGLDSAGQVAIRITKAALAMARSIPLGAQATVAVETLEVLRKHGLTGIYGIMLREEFMAAADLLRKALGINKTSWPLSVHELSAAIFYSFAQHRAMRGLNPEREHLIHSLRTQEFSPVDQRSNSAWTRDDENYERTALSFYDNTILHRAGSYDSKLSTDDMENASSPLDPRQSTAEAPPRPSFTPVCDPVPDHVISSLLFYAPIALNFVYAEKAVDMQLLAAQQGWRLLYAFLEQETGHGGRLTDRPASAVFVHHEFRIVCLAIRGTASINDVITDIRQIPVPFPENDPGNPIGGVGGDDNNDDDWTNILSGQGFALCGMAAAAVNLYREHIDSLMLLVRQGYRIRITGHSLGGGVATLFAVLVLRHMKRNAEFQRMRLQHGVSRDDVGLVRVYTYGTPSCVDAKLAESVDPFVTAVVLHDDAFPRLTPISCRGLLKHLLHIRETWVKDHLSEDLMAIRDRARTAWAPRFRQGFTLKPSKAIKRYCGKKMEHGKKQLLSATGKLVGKSIDSKREDCNDSTDGEEKMQTSISPSDASEWGERFFAPGVSTSIGNEKGEEEMGDGEMAESETEEPGPQLLLEFLGGVDNRTQGIVIDGDEFFDAGDNLVEDDDDIGDSSGGCCVDATPENQSRPVSNGGSWLLDVHGEENTSNLNHASGATDDSKSVIDDGMGAVVLEETTLPKMFVPGKIIHIYSHRGVYKATQVPRTFRELRRISMAGNMLANHTTKAYYEGLLEVQTARTAPEGPPRWTTFDEDDTW
jgi:hypothetical protein